MRVSVVRGGGFAGLSTMTTLDSASLSGAAAAALQAQVDVAQPFAQPSAAPPARAAADGFTYELRVEDGSRSQVLHRAESELTPGLRALVSHVLSAPERERRVLQPGDPELA